MTEDKVNSLKDQGNKAFSGKNYAEAIKFYSEALEFAVGLEDNKVAAILHSNISQAYLQKKEYLNAVESANKSLEFDPSFRKSILRRATGNVELDNITDAMEDLRLILSFEPSNKTAKDLMRRCSDLPKMNRKFHNTYIKYYLTRILKKLGAQAQVQQSEICSNVFRNGLLRQLFLSIKSLDIANYFFQKTIVTFTPDKCAYIGFYNWITNRLMWLEYPYSAVAMILSVKLFRILHELLQPGTFSLSILYQYSVDYIGSLDKYSEIALLKENMLPYEIVDNNDLKIMNQYSNDITRLLYIPGLANSKKHRFPKVKTLIFGEKHLITNDFLKLWKKNEWPIKSLSFVHGVPNLQSLEQFSQTNELVSNNVNSVFIQFAKENHEFDKNTYKIVCNNLSTLKKSFPSLNDVTITHKFTWKAPKFDILLKKMESLREAFTTISTKPEWCPKLKVVVFVEFMALPCPDSTSYDLSLLRSIVKMLCKRHQDMKMSLCGPRSYDTSWSVYDAVHNVVEFKNDNVDFEFAFLAAKLK